MLCSHTITLERGQTRAFTHTHIQTRGRHNSSLLRSSQCSLTVAQGDDQSPLLPIEVQHDWGLALGPYLIEKSCLVSWSIPPMSPVRAQPHGVSKWQSKREPRKPSRSSLFVSDFLHSELAKCSVSRGQCSWNLPGTSRNVSEVKPLRNQAPHLEGWRTQVY